MAGDHGILLYLLQRLDAQGETLKRIEAALSPQNGALRRRRKTGSPLTRLPLLWQWIIGGIVSWGVSASIGSYLHAGGDPLKLITLLLGIFGK